MRSFLMMTSINAKLFLQLASAVATLLVSLCAIKLYKARTYVRRLQKQGLVG